MSMLERTMSPLHLSEGVALATAMLIADSHDSADIFRFVELAQEEVRHVGSGDPLALPAASSVRRPGNCRSMARASEEPAGRSSNPVRSSGRDPRQLPCPRRCPSGGSES